MPRRWEDEDRMHPHIGAGGDRVALPVELANDLLEASNSSFDLDQDHVVPVLELDIDRPPARSGHRRFNDRVPSTVGGGKQSFDYAGVSGVEDHRRTLRVDLEPKVG